MAPSSSLLFIILPALASVLFHQAEGKNATLTPSPAKQPAYFPPPPPPPANPSPYFPPTPANPSPYFPPPPANRRPHFPPPPSAPPSIDCNSACAYRCSLNGRQKLCMRACYTCCLRCNCVPPGTSGNQELCGTCYIRQTTHGGRGKCP
ncbi:hypothetical protein KP509_13G031500 [Ceratopteris richardii]|uniref:Uncharacterized protein n=1 Tax=Ceratopteris richardii TaxID=49495 RepID=A0A8T2TCI6_CERRI|nr:hypothetical protein KP509_13G031500 [Ceratopteris richardii]